LLPPQITFRDVANTDVDIGISCAAFLTEKQLPLPSFHASVEEGSERGVALRSG
jgi:hypothetical protein